MDKSGRVSLNVFPLVEWHPGESVTEFRIDIEPPQVINVRVRREDGEKICGMLAIVEQRHANVAHKSGVVLNHPDVPVIAAATWTTPTTHPKAKRGLVNEVREQVGEDLVYARTAIHSGYVTGDETINAT